MDLLARGEQGRQRLAVIMLVANRPGRPMAAGVAWQSASGKAEAHSGRFERCRCAGSGRQGGRGGALQQGGSIPLAIGHPTGMAHDNDMRHPSGSPIRTAARLLPDPSSPALSQKGRPPRTSAKQSVSSVIVAPKQLVRVWQERLRNQSESAHLYLSARGPGPRKTGLPSCFSARPEGKEIAHPDPTDASPHGPKGRAEQSQWSRLLEAIA
jgi:hypothetical protein